MFKTQIQAILRLDSQSRNVFKGVYAIDQLPPACNSNSAYVINYDEQDKKGSHWVAVFRDKSGNVEYFDSTGHLPLDDRISNFITTPAFRYNPYILQSELSNACGFYCVYYIIQRCRNVKFNDILSLLAQSNSDYIVKHYLYKYYKPIFV